MNDPCQCDHDEMWVRVALRDRRLSEGWKLLTHTKTVKDGATPTVLYTPRWWWWVLTRLGSNLRMPDWDGKVDGREAINQKYNMLAWCSRYMMMVGLFLVAFLAFNITFQLDRAHDLTPGVVALYSSLIGVAAGVIAFIVFKMRAVVVVNRERELAVYDQKEQEAKEVAFRLSELLAENHALRNLMAVTDEESEQMRVQLQERLRKLRNEDA